MTLEEYLEKVSAFADNDYGRMVRDQFQNIGGCSELAMLASPNQEELEQLQRAVHHCGIGGHGDCGGNADAVVGAQRRAAGAHPFTLDAGL